MDNKKTIFINLLAEIIDKYGKEVLEEENEQLADE